MQEAMLDSPQTTSGQVAQDSSSRASDRPAKIITVFNQKGGAGKTNTTCQIAGNLGRMGYRVLIADLDPQESASDWKGVAEGVNFQAAVWSGHRYTHGVTKELKNFLYSFDVILADCAPSVLQPATSAMLLVSDLVLIPTMLSTGDLLALQKAKRLYQTAIEKRGEPLPVLIVPNKFKPNLVDHKEAMDALKEDKEFPLAPPLGDRVFYQRAMAVGATVHDVKGGEDCAKEVDALTKEIVRASGLRKIAKR